MSEIVFSEIREDDLAEILSIYTYYILHSNATFHTHVLSPDEMRELVFFDNPRYRTYVIKTDDEICGYVILTQHKKREAYNDTAEVTIYLRPEYTGRGIGGQAIGFIEEFAGRQNMHVLIATISGDNHTSIELFEKNGYSKCAHYKEVGKKNGQILDLVAYQKILS